MEWTDPIGRLLGSWAGSINTGSILFRVALSVVLAAVIGCERATKRHSAGLRTFILAALASTAAMLIDLSVGGASGVWIPVVSGASVIGAAMVSGNSILFSSKSQIKGLTTSAGLWACGLLGLAAGAGLYTVTLALFVALFCILSLLPRLERFLKDRSNHFEVHLELKSRANLQDFITTIRRLGLHIDDIESNPAYLNSGLSVYSVSMTIDSKDLKKYKRHSEIIEALRTLDYIYYIGEMD